MKKYFLEILSRINQFSNNFDDLIILKNQHWVSFDEYGLIKKVFIFRNEGELLISENGIVCRAKWEYLGNKSLLIDIKNETFLLKVEFCDNDIIAMKIDNSRESVLFINENKHGKEINTLNDVKLFLEKKYLVNKIKELQQEKFYYISNALEYGPVYGYEITQMVDTKNLNINCFVRKSTSTGYNEGLRIRDIINL